MQATTDNTNYMVVKEAVGFFKDMGGIVSTIATVSYYNLDLSFCLSVYQLRRQFWLDRAETWQEGQGRPRIESKGISFHGNQTVAIVFIKHHPVALILGLCWQILAGRLHFAISVCLPKMSEIYHTA